MSEVNKEDIFATLRRYDVCLRPHVEIILRKLGFECLKSLQMMGCRTIEDLEKDVQSFLANDEYLATLKTIDDRKKLFGELYATNPSAFKFLPGERYSILAAIDTAKTLVEKYSEQYDYDRSPHQNRKRKRTENCVPAPEKSSLARKTLEEYVARWLTNTKYSLSYRLEDCKIDEEKKTIGCLICRGKVHKATFDSRGCWKISSFVRHLVEFHSKSKSLNQQSSSDKRTSSNVLNLEISTAPPTSAANQQKENPNSSNTATTNFENEPTSVTENSVFFPPGI